MTQKYPDASVHSLTGNWWEAASGGAITRGRLIKVTVPYPDMKPMRLVPESRGDDARQHQHGNYRLEEYRQGDPIKKVSALPLAATPLRIGETYLVRRGKTRPAIVVATEGVQIQDHLKRGGAAWQHKPALLVAPYYGVEADGSRGGWNPEFVARIQRAEYSQYIWDILPIAGSDEGSILRLDHVFPVGADSANWELFNYRLRADALTYLDEWLSWHTTGTLPADGLLAYTRTELAKLAPPEAPTA